MLYSIRGKVTLIDTRFIVVETCGIGYEVLVANPKSFILGDEVSLFLHHEIKEDDEYLAGFMSQEEKDVFKLLLRVNGIGPKSAITILSNVSYADLLSAISNNDINFIQNVPGIGERVAYQILLDLKEYIAKSNKQNVTRYKEVREALKILKFKAKEIDTVLPNIYIPNATNDMILKEALKRLEYAKNSRQESSKM